MKKIIKYTLTISILLVILTSSLLLYTSYYVYYLALDPTSDKTMFLEHLDQTVSLTPEVVFDVSEEVTITSYDDLQLHGYLLPQESNVWVITVHGYMSKGSEMGWAVKRFQQMGYNILSPDLRGHGKSEGEYIAMGWDDRLDIQEWISYLIEKDQDCQIILFGVSMGAATVMNTGGERLPSNVKMIIEDSGYTNTKDIFSHHLENTFEIPAFPLLTAATWMTQMQAGYSIEQGPIHQLSSCHLPILFIHGEKDTFVPVEMMETLYASYQGKKEKLLILNAGHVQSNEVDSKTYWKTIEDFINQHLE